MKTILVSLQETAVHELLQQASQENLILQTADGREFILAEIDDFEHEIGLTRQNEELMRLLDVRGREKGTVSLAEARERLDLAPEPTERENRL